MTLSLDFSKLSPLVTDKTLILTPNARTQKAVYSGQFYQLPEGQVLEAVDVRSFSQWLNDLWSELSFSQVLPQKLTNLTIKSWLEKQVIEESAWTLTNPSGVATKVLEGYQNLVQWNLKLSNVGSNETVEIDYFKMWIGAFEQFCTDNHLIAEFKSLSLVLKKLEPLKTYLPKHLLLVGFNQLTPLQQDFLNSLNDVGVRVEKYEFESTVENACQVNFSSFQNELEFAANYAKTYEKSGTCVGIVVEQLASRLADVHNVFSRVFQPEEAKPWNPLSKPKYNVSAGFSLAEQPLIKAALFLLNLKSKRISLDDIHFLKNTPFIDWGRHSAQIKYHLHQLCLNPRKFYSISFLLKSIAECEEADKLEVLRLRLSFVDSLSSNQMPILQHIERWRLILSTWAWCESRELNDFEIQAKNNFFGLINNCSSLADIYKKIYPKDSLDFLNQLAKQQAFQVATDRTNVHVLGVLEASGLQFDHLIIIGFNNANWPQRNKINPFLPLKLQREYDMPGSTAEREFEYANDLSASLLKSARQLIVTTSSDESNHAISASFFSHLVERQVDEFVVEIPVLKTTPNYQWVKDSNVDLSGLDIKGGAYLLSDYAKCPFKSMANFQLKLSGYQTPDVGVEPKTKGSWLHETMEIIWQELESQQNLIDMSRSDLNRLVTDSLNTCLLKHQPYLLATTEAEIIQLELNKLANLILEWLEIEKQRDEFVVEHLEKEFRLDIEGLNLKFRIDRVDINKKKDVEIIDYKTGKTEIRNWFGVRPTEAQMPAYVLSMQDSNISGLNYARIKTGEVAQTGLRFQIDSQEILKEDRFLQTLKTGPLKEEGVGRFDNLLQQWQKSLSRIAYGISNGYMPVSPKNKNLSCLYCEFHTVCRINEDQPLEYDENILLDDENLSNMSEAANAK